MAKKQITDRSSASERAQAADELRQAQREYSRWLEQARNDPNRERDIFEGVDYGPLISYEDVVQQKRIIAGQFDYVDFGDLDGSGVGNSLQIGGEDFFVPGVGSNPDSSVFTSPPSNNSVVSSSDDAVKLSSGLTAAPDIPVSPVTPSFGNTVPDANPNVQQQPLSNIGNRLENLDSNDPRVQNFNNDIVQFPSIGTPGASTANINPDANDPRGNNQIPGSLSNVTVNPDANDPRGNNQLPRASTANVNPDANDPRGANQIPGSSSNVTVNPDANDPRGNNQIPTTGIGVNTDDSGNVAGTGIENGSVTTSTNNSNDSNSVEDTNRPDDVPGNGNGTGNDTTVNNGTANSGDVDVSSLGQPRQGNGTGLYEVNPADLEIRQNVLHNYVNWTYNIGMYMLDLGSFNQVVKNGGVTDPANELKNLLFRSGGAGRKGILGENKDYYIDNFRFTSIVGQNSQGAKSSNNFDIAFDIYEPYGVAFLAELVQLAYSKGIEDHFEVPYLMEIKFNGYDSAGNPIPNIPGSGPKYIPIKIIDIKFSITSAATVYHVSAVPYAHMPLQDQHDAFIRDSISLTGETFEQIIAKFEQHLNQAEANKAEEEQRPADTYKFLIADEDLKNSKVGFTHATQGGVVDVARQGMLGNTDEAIQINANSTIKSAIQSIANATDFGARFNTTGQPESNQGNENRPYRLIKVITSVTDLGPYNTSTMRYRKTVVYKIETQKMYGFIAPGMPAAGAQTRGWQKEYNWIFTGKNQDILDFQAEYNIQYFQIRNSFVDQKGRVAGTLGNQSQPLENKNLTRTEAGGNTYNPATRTASQPVTDQIYNSYRGPGHQQASDNMDNVLNNPGADMLAIDLAIIGDPDFIPQDRSVLPRGNNSSGDARIVNGSLAIDSHDTFVMLKFKTPRDYDPEKGLMQIDTEQTFVQGLYRLITLESIFEAGKFQQNLKLIRVQNQVSNDASNLPPLTTVDTTDDARAARTNISSDPGRADPTSRLDTKGQIQTNSRVNVNSAVTVDQTDDDRAGATRSSTAGPNIPGVR